MITSDVLIILTGSNHKERGGDRAYTPCPELPPFGECLGEPYRREFYNRRKAVLHLIKSKQVMHDGEIAATLPNNQGLVTGPDFGDNPASGQYLPAILRFTGRLYSKLGDVREQLARGIIQHHVLILTPLYGLVTPAEPIQCHGCHVRDHLAIHETWATGRYNLTAILLEYVKQYNIRRIFDLTGDRAYRDMIQWYRIREEAPQGLQILHGFGKQNWGPDVLPALGEVAQQLLQMNAEDIRKLGNNREMETKSEWIVLSKRPVAPEVCRKDPIGWELEFSQEVENLYPYPIARSFYLFHGIAGWLAEIPQIANVATVSVQHIAMMAIAECLRSGTGNTKAPTFRFEKGYPPTLGNWAADLRIALDMLGPPTSAMVVQDLVTAWRYPRAQEVGFATEIHELVKLRNELLKERVDTLPEEPEHQQFKQKLHRLLERLAFLKQYPLCSKLPPVGMSRTSGCSCLRHTGFSNDFTQDDLDPAQRVKPGHVFVLNAQTQQVLDLHPYYLYASCPECGKMDLFRSVREDDYQRDVEYVAHGHTLRRPDAYVYLQQRLHGVYRQ